MGAPNTTERQSGDTSPLAENSLTPDGLAAFVQENSGWMMGVALRILLDRGHAEDAVQSAFSRILEKAESFEGRGSFRGWMHRITINEALMLRRRIRSRREFDIETLQPRFDSGGCRLEPELTEIVTPEQLLGDAQTVRAVTMAIRSLPEDYRIVVCLRDIEGLNTREVSTQLGISEANVKVRLHRARAALKTLLQRMRQEGQL
ncbi:sigma-70 family RNA polymerase sigma factor [uncultured Roseobacter sp.]|uniref:RNA polymerase sigma factor n=1 Tax=uncultured Roseobacter sp. TaxID=114847 RepID=UPI0026385F61|nr:sigma-70 family RNA polymerase sigma factor [uncultured Roseobacter sp.]